MVGHLVWLCVLLHLVTLATAASHKAKCGKYQHGDKWDHASLPCMSYRCRNGTIFPKYTGCIKDGQCYDVDQKWDKDCNTFTCISYTVDTMTYFETKIDMRCTTNGKGKNKCRNHGEKWKDGCDMKTCEVTSTPSPSDGKTQYTAQVVSTQKGCRVGKKCYYNGDTWVKNCVWHTCHVTDAYTKTVGVPGCKQKNKCYKIGKKHSLKNKHGCYKYVCEQTGQEVGWKILSAACIYKRKCMDHGATWKVKTSCVEMKCISTPYNNGTHSLTIEEKAYGCVDGRKCRSYGSSWMDSNCSRHKCRMNAGVTTDEIVKTVCKDKNGVCQDWNSGPFEGLVKKGGKSTVFKNCKCEKTETSGSRMTCTEEPPAA